MLPCTGSFATETQTAAIYEHSVYSIEKNQIHVRTLQVSTNTEVCLSFARHLNYKEVCGS